MGALGKMTIDIGAAIRLGLAANTVEAPPTLTEDAIVLFNVYNRSKMEGGFHAKNYDMNKLINAVANVTSVVQKLSRDPNHMKDILILVNSL